MCIISYEDIKLSSNEISETTNFSNVELLFFIRWDWGRLNVNVVLPIPVIL